MFNLPTNWCNCRSVIQTLYVEGNTIYSLIKFIFGQKSINFVPKVLKNHRSSPGHWDTNQTAVDSRPIKQIKMRRNLITGKALCSWYPLRKKGNATQPSRSRRSETKTETGVLSGQSSKFRFWNSIHWVSWNGRHSIGSDETPGFVTTTSDCNTVTVYSVFSN